MVIELKEDRQLDEVEREIKKMAVSNQRYEIYTP